MLKIGICEDMAEERKRQKEMLCRIVERQDWNVEVGCFESGEDLLEEIKNHGDMDIIFMDIAMKGMDGVETARAIREMDMRISFIFVSGYDQYYKEIIDTQPFAFIDKPVEESRMEEVLKRAVKAKFDLEEYFEFISDRRSCRLPLWQIRYFESDGRRVHINGIRKQYVFYEKLDKVEAGLKESKVRFQRIHRSYLVNVRYVRDIGFDRIVLDDDTEIPVSKKYRNEIRRSYLHEWRKERR